MSMIGNFRRVRGEVLDDLLANPDAITAVLYEREAPEADALDIDKAWHGLHFLLTGDAWDGEPPLNFIVGGGAPIGDVDVGYGPARGFAPDEVRAIAAALAPITEATLRARFDPGAMMDEDIYPTIWDRPAEEDDTLGYLVDYFSPLKAFVTETAEQGLALIVYCN